MKPEQRLLLALTLTLGILMVWSAISPPLQPPKDLSQAISRKEVVEKIETPEEPSREISIPPYSIAVGSVRGGLKDIRIGEDILLEAAQPGFLQVELMEPAGQ